MLDPGTKSLLQTVDAGGQRRDSGIGLFPGFGGRVAGQSFRLFLERLRDARLDAVFDDGQPDGKRSCLLAGALFGLADALGQLGGLLEEQALHVLACSRLDTVHLAGEVFEEGVRALLQVVDALGKLGRCAGHGLVRALLQVVDALGKLGRCAGHGLVRVLLQVVDALGKFGRCAGHGLFHAGLDAFLDTIELCFELVGLAADAFLELAQPAVELGGPAGNQPFDLLGNVAFNAVDFFKKFVKTDRRPALLLVALAGKLLDATRQISLGCLHKASNLAVEVRLEAFDARGEVRNPLLLLGQRLGILLSKPAEVGADVLVLLVKEGRHLRLEASFEGLHAHRQIGEACLEAGLGSVAGAGQIGQAGGKALDLGLAAGLAQGGKAVCEEALHALLQVAVQGVEAFRRFGKAVRKLARTFLALAPEGVEPRFDNRPKTLVDGLGQALLGAGHLLGDAQAYAVFDAQHLVGDD